MADLSDETGRKAMDMFTQTLSRLFNIFNNRDQRQFVDDKNGNVFEAARAYLAERGLEDPFMSQAEDRLKELNGRDTADPWVDAGRLVGGMEVDLPGFAGGATGWVWGEELRKRLVDELEAEFGEGLRCEFVGNHLLVPSSMEGELFTWAMDKPWADLIEDVGHGGEKLTWVTVKLPDKEASAELVDQLVAAGLCEVSRCKDDPTQVVAGFSGRETPAFVECLQKSGVGRDAVAGLGERATSKLSEKSERDPGGVPGEPPRSYCEARAAAEPVGETARAVAGPKAEKEAAERAEEWRSSPVTEKQAAVIRSVAKEKGVPDEEVERALTNKLEANRFLDKWYQKLPGIDFSEVAYLSEFNDRGERYYSGDVPDEAYAYDIAAIDAARGRKAARDAAQEQELDPPDDVYAGDIAAQQPDGSAQLPVRQDRERETGTKEIYTGDRVVEATTYDRENPVGSDGQDAAELNVAEDDMSYMRDKDKKLEDRIASMTDEELEELLSRCRPMHYQEQNACAAVAADQHMGREEVSIPDPQR